MENGMTDTVVDKLLLEAIKDKEAEIIEITLKVEVYNEAIRLKRDMINEYKLAYQNACPHPKIERKEVSHMAGGYDHVSETQYRDICARCGMITGSKLVRGTYA